MDKQKNLQFEITDWDLLVLFFWCGCVFPAHRMQADPVTAVLRFKRLSVDTRYNKYVFWLNSIHWLFYKLRTQPCLHSSVSLYSCTCIVKEDIVVYIVIHRIHSTLVKGIFRKKTMSLFIFTCTRCLSHTCINNISKCPWPLENL